MTQPNTRADLLQRFSFDQTDIRGEIAYVGNSLCDLLERHSYPELIQVELGKLMAATALLSANLKFAGRLTLQIRLLGNVSLLQAETNELGELRAIARYDQDADTADLTFENGQLVITIEPEQGQRYQGITAIEGGDIAAAMQGYFEQSEQLESRFWLESDGQKAAGFMLQKMPSMETNDADAWNRLTHLASTMTTDELLQLENETLLNRLYHEEAIRVYPASTLKFHCTCSHERIGKALLQLGADELNHMMAEQPNIDINCEFCQQHYRFDKADIDALLGQHSVH